MFPLLTFTALSLAAPPTLTIDTKFPGGNAVVDILDQEKRVIAIHPYAHKDRGWACWWSFKLSGLEPGETFTLRVKGDGFSKPERAAISQDDGKTWTQTPAGKMGADKVMTYTITAPAKAIWLAWGPPYQLADAKAAVERVAAANVGATAFELCKSREGRSVPAIRWDPPAKPGQKRRGIWIEARQHAWESGGSWVGQGLLDFLASDDPDAKALRENSRIVYVPIMDVDNVELGAGGKNQVPFDHNRDWNDTPVHPAVAAAQAGIKAMDAAGEFDLFIDLHNPAPNDKVPFFNVPPESHMPAARVASHERFLRSAVAHMGREPLKLQPKPLPTGAGYDKLWQKISKNWVALHTNDRSMAFTLETSWNTPHSTTDGYRAFGKALGKTIAEVLQK